METAKSTGGISVLNMYVFIKDDPADEAVPSEFGLELQVIFSSRKMCTGLIHRVPPQGRGHRAGEGAPGEAGPQPPVSGCSLPGSPAGLTAPGLCCTVRCSPRS